MNTPKTFDYDLWTTEDSSGKHYWSRVKATGEVSEVSLEVMRYLRALEKKARKQEQLDRERSQTHISYEQLAESETDPDYGRPQRELEDQIILKILLEDFRQSLSPGQRAVVDGYMEGELTRKEYGHSQGLAEKKVDRFVERIRKNAKKFF